MKKITFLIAFAICSLITMAQARWQADVSVTSVTLSPASIIKQPSITNGSKTPPPVNNSVTSSSPNIKCSITVHNENDDDAYGTTLVVTLPVEVTVASLSQGGTTHTASTSTQYIAYITFDLGHMTVGQNSTVEFTFTPSKYGNKVGAFAYSGSPDPNPTNNYKDATY